MAINSSSILQILIFIGVGYAQKAEYRKLAVECENWQYNSYFGCQDCSYQCQTCTNFSICSSCLDLNHRQMLDNQCQCQQGYFDIVNQSTCGQCHQECVDCYGPLRNNCLTCPSSKNINKYNICSCGLEYYLDQFTKQCQLCNINCLACIGPNSNDCLQCDNTKTLVSSECVCNDLKSYNNYLTGQCVQCDPNCNQCNGPNSIDCLNCNVDKLIIGSQCKCQSNQYEINQFGFINCVQCHPSCLTCYSNHQNNCLTCQIHSTLTAQNFCICDDGYFENNYTCEQCDSTCLLCQYASTYCISCNVNDFLLFNQCVCPNQKTDSTCSSNCVDPLCEKCNRLNASMCFQCVANTSLDSGLCTCLDGFYFLNGVCNACPSPSTCIGCYSFIQCKSCLNGFYGNVCQSNCPANCTSCNNASTCTSCITGYSGSFCSTPCNPNCLGCSNVLITYCTSCQAPNVLIGNICGCPDHYYGGSCNIACPSACKTCINAVGCTSCSDSKRALPDCLTTCVPNTKTKSDCNCETGYYLDSANDCQDCDSKCLSCLGSSTFCQDCYNIITNPNNQNRFLIQNECRCQFGFLDTGLDFCVVPTCGNACKDCTGSVCSECITVNTFRQDIPALNCPCIDGYYEAIQTAICIKCPNKCSTCTLLSIQTANVCLICEGQNRILNYGCTCIQGYYDNGNHCEKCSIGCQECLNQTTCVICKQSYIYLNGTCICAIINYINNHCQCLDGYYLDQYTYRCLPCQLQCKTCILTSSNCLDCNQSSPLQIRVNPPKCNCSPTFYEKDLQCQSCLSKCQECQDNNICTSCIYTKILESTQCKCQQSGYFDSPYFPFDCQQCDTKCLQCEFSPKNCTQCSNNRLSEPICYCPTTYYVHIGDNSCEKCNSKCQECYGYETNCSQCGINRSNPPLCSCNLGYYEDSNEICIKCEPQCIDCQDSPNNCTTCSYLRIEPSVCKCQDGYYETTEKQCLPCHFSCLTCLGPNEYNCLSCDELKFRSQSLFKCPCKSGYFQRDGICVTCTIDVTYCQPQVCGDGIKLALEECDDGNLVSRDGCTNQCLLESGYYCENKPNYAIHPLIQISQCQKCTPNCLVCHKEVCIKCQSTYYLTEQFICRNCNEHCKECDGPQQSNCQECIQGFDFGFSQKCSFCKENIGFYTGQNSCITKCGDMIFKENYEQCDDGNILNGDGCSKDCLIEEDFECTNTVDSISVCLKIDFPFADFQFEQDYSIYDNIRYGTLNFNKPMVYQAEVENSWIYTIANYSSFKISIMVMQNNNSELIGLQLKLELLELINDGYLTVDFSQQPIKASENNLELKPLIISSSFGQYYKLSDKEISTTQKSMAATSIILFIYLGILILGILLQNFDFFWNLLDLLQIISYYQLFNVKFPYIVNQYLTIFSFARLDFLNEIIEFNWVNEINTSIKSDYPFLKNNDLSSNFLLNMQSFLTVWLFTIFTKYMCQILLISLYYLAYKKIKLQKHIIQPKESLYNWLLYRSYKVIRYLFKSMRSYISGFPSNYLQVYISTIYDFNLCVFTTIYCSLRYDSFNDFELSFIVIAVTLLSLQIIGIYLLIPTITAPHYQLKTSNFKSKYSGLFEGMRVYDLTSRKLAFAMIIRRIIFISFIALLYDDPSYQVGVQACVQITFLVFAIVINPFRAKMEKIKSIITETSLTFTIFLIYVYNIQNQISIFSDEHFEQIGYVHIGVYSLMLFANLVIDVLTQIKEIINNNKYLKELKDKCFPSQKIVQYNQENINRILFF